jgi:hypothetical protein
MHLKAHKQTAPRLKYLAASTAVPLLLALSACGAHEGAESVEPLERAAQPLTARGWDPFLNTPNAWTVGKGHQFCVGGACSNPGHYTIGNGNGTTTPCPVRGVGYDTYGPNGLCPNWFNWEWDSSVGRWKAHIISVPAVNDGYQYVGLQQSIQDFPFGDLSNQARWPRVATVHSVHIQVRARYCASSSNARLPYYFSWVSPSNRSIDGQVSIDLLTYLGAPPAPYMPDPGRSYTEWELASRSGAQTNPNMLRTFEVNGPSWGVTPNNYSSSQLWCYSSINNAPWLDFSINIPAIISRLQQEGRLPTPLPSDLQYSGGILGGIEFWGAGGGWAEVELRDHEIWVY